MMRYIICIVLACMLFSCSSNEDVPGDVLPITKMKFVMYDVYSAQELAIMNYPKDTTAARQRTLELFQQVFEVHKISRDDFYKSFHYYEANPDKMKILTDSLNAYGNRKRQEMYKKML